MRTRRPQRPHTRHGARLGQHFLTRPEIAGWVADAAGLTPESEVLEIGPGHGVLTRELLVRAGKVIAIEKDPALAEELRGSFATDIAAGRLTILARDIRDVDPSTPHAPLPDHYTLVANIPYYLTGHILRMFLTAQHQPDAIAVLIQREVAERVVAKDGKESLLSLSVKAYGTPEVVRIVRPGAFNPPPKVDSSILAVREISRANFPNGATEARFFALLHAAFSSRRKTLGSTLRAERAALAACDIPETARPEDVPLEKWLLLCRGNDR